MITVELKYFEYLKQALEKKYKEHYPDCALKITDWRQQEIIRFQKLMQEAVKDRISEKWFYTHIKPEKNDKLPRVDTLNLLAEFLGYANWEAFKNGQGQKIESIKDKQGLIPFFKKNRISIAIIIIVMIISGIAYSNITFSKTEPYIFCFVNADDKDRIVSENIEITVLHQDQSPEIINCDTNACFTTETSEEKISFIVKAKYYKPDTIIRYLNKKKRTEIIKLKQDDYALMIHLFSTSKIKDWEKQRNHLDKMIAEDAEIYQIDDKERGVEIYNKEEFIDKMTMPLNSLKNIEIVELAYQEGKISMMRFIQRTL
jgi:hypothetical protein